MTVTSSVVLRGPALGTVDVTVGLPVGERFARDTSAFAGATGRSPPQDDADPSSASRAAPTEAAFPGDAVIKTSPQLSTLRCVGPRVDEPMV